MNTDTDRTQPPSTSSGPLAGRTVADVATVGILACSPDAPLKEVAWLMANNRVHAVLIVDDDHPEPPVIADADLIAAAATGHFEHLCARDIAGTEGVSVREDDTLERAGQLLTEHGVAHLVVRDHRRMPIGILSTLDVARAICDAD
jgi:CBS domain-containing protein